MTEVQDDERRVLEYLDNLRTSDPDLFSKTMAALASQGNAHPEGPGAVGDLLKELSSPTVSQVERDLINLPGLGKQLGKKGVEDKLPGITITPEPGFVVKTKMLSTDAKIFINLCTHEEIEKPGLKKKLGDDGQPVEGMNIPLSVGPRRQAQDKSGIDCVVYDIIVNPDVVKEAISDETGRYKDFVCQLCIQALEQKYQLALEKRYKLPKVKYMGKVESQYIRDSKKAPRIEEVAEAPAVSPSPPPPAPTAPVVELPLPHILSWVHHDQSSNPNIEFSTTSEYVEPVMVPPDSVSGVEFLVEVDRPLSITDINIQLSSYKLQVKVKGFLLTSVNLPCGVLPEAVQCSLTRPANSIKKREVRVFLPVDRREWDSGPDPGSKQWLLAKALQNDDGVISGEHNPYSESSQGRSSSSVSAGSVASSVPATAADDDEVLPEDKFHIRLPANVDKYTGLPLDTPKNANHGSSAPPAVVESDELAEDRFHKSDAGSSYIISQREQAVKDKWDKHARDKEERKNDDNVEYIDVEDFKPGGKYGPKVAQDLSTTTGAMTNDSSKVEAVRSAAARVVQESLSGLDLSSNLWSELLD